MSWGTVIAAGVSLATSLAQNNQLDNAQDAVNRLTEFRPQGFMGPGGFGITTGGVGTMGADQRALMQGIEGQSAGLIGGGLFNDPNFQSAFNANDMLGALNQANTAFGQQAGNTAFGGMQGLFDNMSGLSNAFSTAAAQGPQDLTGGLQANLFQQGAANQAASLDQSGLFNQFLDTQRQAATSGGLLDRAINKLQDRQFATGRLGTTGGSQETGQFLDSLARQDLGFQNNAFGLANQRSDFLANLGSQQIGQGAGLLNQNLGQFNQMANFADMFSRGAAGLEGQQFGQMLAGLQQNQTAGMNRLQAAQGLFGLGTSTFGDQFNLGLAGQDRITNMNQLFANLFLGQQNAAANRIAATQGHADALTQSGSNRAGLLGGIGSMIGGLFG